jgi:hypothetical protein
VPGDVRIHQFPFLPIPIPLPHTFFQFHRKKKKAGQNAATVLPAYVQVIFIESSTTLESVKKYEFGEVKFNLEQF